MAKLAIRRLAMAVPLLFAVSVMVFMLVPLIPGDPAVTISGENATDELIAQNRERLGLDRPLAERYLDWAGDALTGDLGTSLFNDRRVTDELIRRLPVTLSLAGLALVFGIVVGVTLGMVAGLRPGRPLDRIAVLVASLGVAVPNFWLGLLLVIFFAISLGWLPATGYVPLTESPWEWFRSLILPGIALGTAPAAELTRQVRAGLADAMRRPYVQTALAKGLRRRKVIVKHALKNTGVTILTVLGIQASVLLGASVVVEQVFGLPGIGAYTVAAVLNRDMPSVQGVVLSAAVIILVTNLLVDLLYGYFNPRVREAST